MSGLHIGSYWNPECVLDPKRSSTEDERVQPGETSGGGRARDVQR